MMKLIFMLLTFLISAGTFADSYNMRDCMLLPITDDVGNSVGYKVYDKVEEYLKDKKWCQYIPSSDLLSVFSRYREKLQQHLKDPLVVKTVADNLQVGTLIRVHLTNEVDKVRVELDVVGESGEDLYFSEKTILPRTDIDTIADTINNWLDVYEAQIPYDGKVLGVLGDQITFTIDNMEKYSVGQDFEIKKYLGKSNHPLLKKVVSWESKTIAKGKIISISKHQALGTIKTYYSKEKPSKGEWVKLLEINYVQKPDKSYEGKPYSFGKLGEATLSLEFSNSNVGTKLNSGSIKAAGNTFGFAGEVELWITREYFAMMEISRGLGALSNKSGDAELSQVNVTRGHFKLAGGYKFLPLGFFYGPQINLYAGYANYLYNLESSAADGYGEGSISGLMLGIGGNIPLDKSIRIFGAGEMMPMSDFQDSSNIFGSEKSTSSLVIKFGTSYQYSPTMKLVGSINLINNTAKFRSSPSEINYKDTVIRGGATVTF